MVAHDSQLDALKSWGYNEQENNTIQQWPSNSLAIIITLNLRITVLEIILKPIEIYTPSMGDNLRASHLDVFSLRFIVENVGDMFGENLLSPSTSVDSHHGHTDWPGSITNGHLQVGIICLDRRLN